VFLRKHNHRGSDGPVSEERIRQWLIAHLADKLAVDPSGIDTARAFEEYGLDSRAGIQMCGKLEKLVEIRLSPALLYEYPSIDAVVEYLGKRLAETPDQ
jgi:acyl carrier protein